MDFYQTCWLRLLRTKGLGPKTFWRLIKKHPNLEELILLLQNKGYEVPNALKIENEIQQILKKNIKIAFPNEAPYPSSLKILENPPMILFYKGNISLLKKECFGIVGARNASIHNQKLAFQIAHELNCQCDLVIVSGFARGIDTQAHKGSLTNGTIAVFANGLDIIYPPENEKLYNDIIHNGLLISEAFPGSVPTTYAFPVRNRIIAGLVNGLLVIEASFKSGTMITAENALNLGKNIFVVPGHPFDPRSRGGNKLIKDGAYLIENARDIMSIMNQNWQNKDEPDTLQNETLCNSSLREKILNHLSLTPINQDELIEKIGEEAKFILRILTDLEIEGRIIKENNGKISLGS